MEPKFFSTADAFRKWLDKNHNQAAELLLGFHKKSSRKKSITYPEALDEALSYGWIDGVRKSLDDTSYTIRFTPRRPTSIWSLVNVRHVERLKNEGRMKPAGLAAYNRRDEKKTGIYSFEKESAKFSTALLKVFRANKTAWKFFQEQPPGYRKNCAHWVMSAKQGETRARRLQRLLNESAGLRRVGLLSSKGKT